MRRGYPVVRYVGGSSSANTERWRNRRVQSYMLLRDEFRDGMITFDEEFIAEDDYDDFVAQVCSIRTRPEQTRVEDLMTKEQMKSDGIKSPDRADSLAMQYATQQPQYETGRGASTALMKEPEVFLSPSTVQRDWPT